MPDKSIDLDHDHDPAIWLCQGGCGAVDVRADEDYAHERRCMACGAFADRYAAVDALLSDEAVKHAADALRDLLGNDTGFWPDSYEEVRTVLKAAVEKTGGQDV